MPLLIFLIKNCNILGFEKTTTQLILPRVLQVGVNSIKYASSEMKILFKGVVNTIENFIELTRMKQYC
jgi:hypothetical protein